jgi:hypothetical protein
LGEGSALSYVNDQRPPQDIPQLLRNMPPTSAAYRPQPTHYPQHNPYPPQGAGAAGQSEGPISLHPQGAELEEDEEPEIADTDPYAVPGAKPLGRSPYGNSARPDVYPQSRAPYSTAREAPLPPLGPQRDPGMAMSSAATITPAATLACPMVSALDQWLARSVQPAAQRWFGQQVIEIKQISAYSCRGMNGQRGAQISEHAFGNALDVAAFTLADGRRITVKGGWRGEPEEQGFLRDVQAAACQQFSTVLAPGSNVYHYDHIHVDLRRRRSDNGICKPAAVSGEVVAQRAREQRLTGRGSGRMGFTAEEDPKVDFGITLPRAVPGAD